MVAMAGQWDQEPAMPGRFIVLRDSIVGDQAWVYYTDAKASNKIVTMQMTKVDGKWKVDAKMGK